MEVIVQRVADGEFLKEIARAWEVPYGKLAQWIIEDVERSELYARARRFAVGAAADEMVRVTNAATPETIPVVKEQNRVAQWRAEKLDKQTFGPSLQVQHTGETVLRLSFGAAPLYAPAQPVLTPTTAILGPGRVLELPNAEEEILATARPKPFVAEDI